MKKFSFLIIIALGALLASCEKETLPECEITHTAGLTIESHETESYTIVVNGEVFGTIEPGELKKYNVSIGENLIQFKETHYLFSQTVYSDKYTMAQCEYYTLSFGK